MSWLAGGCCCPGGTGCCGDGDGGCGDGCGGCTPEPLPPPGAPPSGLSCRTSVSVRLPGPGASAAPPIAPAIAPAVPCLPAFHSRLIDVPFSRAHIVGKRCPDVNADHR